MDPGPPIPSGTHDVLASLSLKNCCLIRIHFSALSDYLGRVYEFINNIMGKTTHQVPTSTTFPDKTLSKSKDISESLNNYFCNIACKLAHDSESTSDSIRSYLPNPTPFSFFIEPTTIQKIEDEIKKTLK